MQTLTLLLRSVRLTIWFSASFFLVASAHANNGLNLIGFGAQSVGMGGADLALASGPFALNINPAGLSDRGQMLDFTSAVAVGIGNSHTDAIGNEADNEQSIAAIGAGGYTRAFSNFTAGIGFFVQGGSGSAFDDIATPFGTRDDLSSLIGIVRVTPGLAWHPSQTFSLGISTPINVAAAKQKIFPNTSTATFSGSTIKDAYAIAPSMKIGALYRVTENVVVGATYSSKADLEFKDAKLTANFAAQGLGRVTYDDTTLKGISLPQQLGIGIAVRALPHLTVAFDVEWLDWSASVRRSTLIAKSPNSSSAPQTIEATSILDWNDQVVFAIGAEYEINDRLALRAGYNYGKSPQPNEHLSPLLVAAGEQTVTMGFGYRLPGKWRLDAAGEWQVGRNVTYSNPESPLGAPSTVKIGYIAAHITATRSW